MVDLDYVEEPAHDDCNPFGDGVENSTDCVLHLTPPNGGFTFAPDSSDDDEPEEALLPEAIVDVVVDIDDPSFIQEPEVVDSLSDLDDKENILGEEQFVDGLDEDGVNEDFTAKVSSAGFDSNKRPWDEVSWDERDGQDV